MGIKQDIRESKDYRKFRKIVIEVQERLNIDKDRTEALSLHAGRTSRKLFGDRRYSPKHLLDASLNDMSSRSRLVELRVKTTNQIDVLHEACKAMRYSMSTNFTEEIKARFKTVGERNAFFDTMIASALEIESEGSAQIKLLDDLIQDVDRASYHLKGVIECLGLLQGSKAGTVI